MPNKFTKREKFFINCNKPNQGFRYFADDSGKNLDVEKFKESLVIEDPKKLTSKSKISWIKSDGYVIITNPETGKTSEKTLFISRPKSSIRFNPIHDSKVGSNDYYSLNGASVRSPIENVDEEDIVKMNYKQKYYYDVLNCIWEKTWDLYNELVDGKNKILPNVSKNALLGARNDDDPEMALKPLVTYTKKNIAPKEEEPEWVNDETKPRKTDFRLECYGTGEELKCVTIIKDQNNENINIYSIVPLNQDDREKHKGKGVGEGLTVEKFDGLFWGPHGTSSRGCSIRMKINDIRFKPVEISTQSLLDDDVNPLDSSSDDEDENEGRSSDFANPLDEEEDDFRDKEEEDEEERERKILEKKKKIEAKKKALAKKRTSSKKK